MTRPGPLRQVNLAVTAVLLIVGAAAMGMLLWVTLSQAGQAPDRQQAYLYRLAIVTLVLLCLVVVFLMVVLMRYIRLWLVRPGRGQPTPYVNSWQLSGQRFRLPPEQEEDYDEDSAGAGPPGGDGNGPDNRGGDRQGPHPPAGRAS